MAACEAMVFHDGLTAHLAAPRNQGEAQFIGALGEAGKPSWLSGKYVGGEFIFVDGTPWRVERWGGWYPGEPNGDFERNEYCVQRGIGRRRADTEPWRLNDALCSNLNRYTCQYCHGTTSTTTEVPTTTTTTPEPTTTSTTTTTTTTTSTTTTTTTTTSTTTTTTSTTTTTTSTTTSSTTTFTTTTTTTPEPTTHDLPTDWNYYAETNCFYQQFDTPKLTYEEAESECANAHESHHLRSHLAIIESTEEAQFVAALETGGAGRPRWVGMKRNNNGQFVDAMGRPAWMDGFYPGEVSSSRS